MDERDRLYLERMVEHAQKAIDYKRAGGRSWWKDSRTLDAVITRITQVAEAAGKVSAGTAVTIPLPWVVASLCQNGVLAEEEQRPRLGDPTDPRLIAALPRCGRSAELNRACSASASSARCGQFASPRIAAVAAGVSGSRGGASLGPGVAPPLPWDCRRRAADGGFSHGDHRRPFVCPCIRRPHI